MKANEAPEKLYVNFHFIETHPESHQPLVTKQGVNKYDIEYTRTDAFIKKAINFLNYNLDDVVKISVFGKLIPELTTRPDFIEHFKKYMEGE